MKYLGLHGLPIFAPLLFISWLFQSSESFHINSPALNLLNPRGTHENQYFIPGTSKHKSQSSWRNSNKSLSHLGKETEEEIPRDEVKKEATLPHRKSKRSANIEQDIKSGMKSAGKTILHETRSGARAVFHQIGDWLG